MWGLTYDYLTGYSMKDMSPAPGLATKWTTSPDGKTWTFTVRSGVKFSDGRAADRGRRRLHLQPDPRTARSSSRTGCSYLNGVTKVTAPNATTVVLKLKKPSRHPAAAADPDRARARLEERQREGDQELRRRADRAASRSSAPARSGWSQGTADGSTFKFEANPDYWGGAPHIDEVDLPVLQERRLRRAGADQGRGRLRREHHRARGEEPPGPARDHRPQRQLAGLRRDRLQHRLGATSRPASPIGNPNPAVLDPKFRHALGYALEPAAADPEGLPGRRAARARRSSRRTTPTTTGSRRPTRSSPSTSTRRAQLLDAAGYTMGSDGMRTCPTASRSAPCGSRRAPTRRRRCNTMDYFKQWLERPRHQARGVDVQLEPADRRDLQGQLRRLPVGLVRRARPRLDAQLHDLRPAPAARRTRSTATSSTTSSTTQQHVQTDQAQARGRRSRRCRRSSTATSPYLVTAYSSIGEAVRSDRFACLVAAAEPRRHLARAVRRLQLHPHEAGGRGGHL